MNILKIIIKEIKHVFRNRQSIALMLLFPIVLIIILGMALSKNFSTASSDIKSVKVAYTNNAEGHIGESFEDFIKNIKGMKISFEKVTDIDKAKKSIKNNEYSCLVEVQKNNKNIKIYKNSKINFKSDLVENIIRSYTNKYNLVTEVAKVNPAAITEILQKNSNDYVNIKSLDKKRTPSSTDYYAITMLTLTIMYASISASNCINNEKNKKTWNRIMVTPIKKHQLFMGKTIGQFLVIIIQMTLIILVSKFLLNAYFGKDILSIYLIILAEAFFTISLGVGIGFLVKSPEVSAGILSAITPFIAFMGGAYFPVENIKNAFFNNLIKVSPIKWVNEAIFKIIYNADYSSMGIAISINLVLGIIFLVISINAMRKEA